MFPWALFAFLNGATATIDVSMYGITHERIVKELVATSVRGRVVRVVVENTLKNCMRSRVKELFDAGIADYVHKMEANMHHENIVTADIKTVVHGSVSFSEHAMASGGLMAIDEEWRFVLLVLQYFGGMMQLLNYRPVELADFNNRVTCSSCKKRFTEQAPRTSLNWTPSSTNAFASLITSCVLHVIVRILFSTLKRCTSCLTP